MILKFEPILKTVLWGGEKLIALKGLTTDLTRIGESWEVSDVPGYESIVADGPHRGKTLHRLMQEMGADLTGHAFGSDGPDARFPLLIKFIDARKDLSIQVHPDNETAQRHGHQRGKTEMWYALKPTPGAQLYNGLRQQLTPETYRQMVADNTITDALARYRVHEGDVFFIPAGRIHSIGAGCFMAEVQQTCDLTYRIYDYNRRDCNGNLRQLHTDKAAESIDYTVHDNYRTYYEPMQDEGVQLITCPYFSTAVYDLNDPMTIDYSELDSFVIFVGLQGSCELTDDSGHTVSFREGETVLLPATTKTVKVDGTIKFLETYV